MGPISPLSLFGNRYILTLSDYFTKWVEATSLPTKEAPMVANEVFNSLVANIGSHKNFGSVFHAFIGDAWLSTSNI